MTRTKVRDKIDMNGNCQTENAIESADKNSQSDESHDAVDMETVHQLKALDSPKDPDFFGRLVDAFVSFGLKNIGQINAALRSSDLISIAKYAHALKGSCSNFGARRAIVMCTEIERLAKEHRHAVDCQALDSLAHKITHEFAEITRVLRVVRQKIHPHISRDV